MKRFRIIAVLALAICLIAGTMSVFAYGHKVTVSAGNGAALVAAIAAAAIAIARRRRAEEDEE